MLDIAPAPVIFLSAYNREETIVRALLAHGTGGPGAGGAASPAGGRVSPGAFPTLRPGRPDPGLHRPDGKRGRTPGPSTPTEYEMLFQLSVNAGRPLSFEHLLERVWGPDHPSDRGWSART